jgi:hypothetical protein
MTRRLTYSCSIRELDISELGTPKRHIQNEVKHFILISETKHPAALAALFQRTEFDGHGGDVYAYIYSERQTGN